MPVLKAPEHPGSYVKANVLPSGMSVTEAAERLGIGRPALSNFLNGNASLSQSMASRLAKAFSISKEGLLSLQQEYDLFKNQDEEKRIAVKSFTPSFLKITATQIEAWSDAIDTRAVLPALIRRLVNTTGAEIVSSDFPAFDNSQRHGWDGLAESNNAIPWIPAGISGWEFGCNKTPATKAKSDYKNRTKSIAELERQNTTFVFITPRNWLGKDEWAKVARAKKEWKDVRAFDASDLEQWLELSVPGQVWLAEQLGIPTKGCESLASYWHRWSVAANPAISSKIFGSAVKDHGDTIVNWYGSSSDKPFVVTAASKEEAMAFLSSVPGQLEELAGLKDQAIFVSSPETMKRLAEISTEFIPIAISDEAESELGTSFSHRSSIIISERSVKGAAADICIELPNIESFKEALADMGFDDAQIDVHSNRSGKSPTILRRQLAKTSAMRKPSWANSANRIRTMVPLVFAGRWNSSQKGDQDILSCLAKVDYTDVEKNVADLVSLDDSPIWSEVSYRGVVSKLDCFQVISDLVIEEDINQFLELAEYVLSEDNPALDLDKEHRWAANLYNKAREYSGTIRTSICENLIILAVYGDGLIGQRLGINIENRISYLIRKLLKNKGTRDWQAQQDDLPMYAEAAPEEFLSIVEEELLKVEPAFGPLFESVGTGAFSNCDRTGMLWALELLAWNPVYLSRVIKILGQLSTIELDDNWVNKPINSLKDILLIWRPHTAATFEQRCEVLEMLCETYPEIGWEVCVQPLKPGSSSTSGTNRPDWRSYASGVGNTLTRGEVVRYGKKCVELALSWPSHSWKTLKDLVSCLPNLTEPDRVKVADDVKAWIDTAPPAGDIIRLREHVRTRTMTTRARKGGKSNESYVNGKELYDLLEPKDPLLKYQWLFAKDWVEYTPEELGEDDFDHDARERGLEKQRLTALSEILSVHGREGLLNLVAESGAASKIGELLYSKFLNEADIGQFVYDLLSIKVDSNWSIDRGISGLMWRMSSSEKGKLIDDVIAKLGSSTERTEKISRLFTNAPFSRVVWDHLEQQDKVIQDKYWLSVCPGFIGDMPAIDINFSISKLIDFDRPRAAFDFAHLRPKFVDSKILIKLLNEVATNASDSDSQYSISQHEIEEALKVLDERDDFDRAQMAKLEFIYVDFLYLHSSYGLPNLSKDISESSLFFMQLVASCFKRGDDGNDPDEWEIPLDKESKKKFASKSYQVLESINVIPGTQEDGMISVDKLREWVKQVRKLASEHSREVITDQKIGKLLSTSEIDEDGMWPKEEIQQVLEEIGSAEISTGMEIGLYNSGGAEFIGVDSSKGQSKALHYREMADRVMNKRPFVGRMLRNIAKSYDRDAEWWSEDSRVNKRIRGW